MEPVNVIENRMGNKEWTIPRFATLGTQDEDKQNTPSHKAKKMSNTNTTKNSR
jgi:hypothetical protein